MLGDNPQDIGGEIERIGLDSSAKRIKDMAKSMEMVAKKSSYKWNLGTHLSFRLLRCNKNIAHLEINANKLLISFVCSLLLK